MIELFRTEGHANFCINDLSQGQMVHTNQHLVIHNDEAILLDPGGHKIYRRLVAQLAEIMPMSHLNISFSPTRIQISWQPSMAGS